MPDTISNNESSEEILIVQVQESGFQPIWHLAVLCFFSFGIYPFFWFYKHWRYLKEEKGISVSPGFRTLFILFTGYSLFNIFKKLAIEKGYKGKTPLAVYFFLYTILVLAANFREVPLVLSFVGLFAFVFLIPALNAMNFYYLKVHPAAIIRKKLGLDEIIFYLLSGEFCLLQYSFHKNHF